ncbi:PaaI family thioesterase [Paucibacter sp. APW11]|uniref:PaaI family thioesterase n=1 Tax=Roseateles aquae TaxID=3077235 RepID=A0ABU3P963_9BURK|nr:PaaI family thioesterase [Paucibacter sp. APW11]MDT8999114.1 PaaI family thioesterase [Paucibacter sp. APW11]
MDASQLQAQIPAIFAPWIAELGLQVLSAAGGQVELELPVKPSFIHSGGVMCGQTVMAAADTAMVLAMMSQLGEFRPMTTVQLQTSFLRPISTASCRIKAQVLRSGKSLAFGSIDIVDGEGRLAAQATTTYALL